VEEKEEEEQGGRVERKVGKEKEKTVEYKAGKNRQKSGGRPQAWSPNGETAKGHRRQADVIIVVLSQGGG
jgi:hypothetical protein